MDSETKSELLTKDDLYLIWVKISSLPLSVINDKLKLEAEL